LPGKKRDPEGGCVPVDDKKRYRIYPNTEPELAAGQGGRWDLRETHNPFLIKEARRLFTVQEGGKIREREGLFS